MGLQFKYHINVSKIQVGLRTFHRASHLFFWRLFTPWSYHTKSVVVVGDGDGNVVVDQESWETVDLLRDHVTAKIWWSWELFGLSLIRHMSGLCLIWIYCSTRRHGYERCTSFSFQEGCVPIFLCSSSTSSVSHILIAYSHPHIDFSPSSFSHSYWRDWSHPRSLFRWATSTARIRSRCMTDGISLHLPGSRHPSDMSGEASDLFICSRCGASPRIVSGPLTFWL